ncbi:MAG: hypothetical protein ACREBU_03015 [Nitrososphaera sp.]
MKAEAARKAIEKMGFRFEKDFDAGLSREVSRLATRGKLTPVQRELLKSIILAKASDIAILEGRKTVKVDDVRSLIKLCIPFIFCFKSSILENPDVTASVLTAADVHSLDSIGITQNRELASANAQKIAKKVITDLIGTPRTGPNLGLTVNLLATRVMLWKLIASLLLSR